MWVALFLPAAFPRITMAIDPIYPYFAGYLLQCLSGVRNA
jgi:hypothetical protein